MKKIGGVDEAATDASTQRARDGATRELVMRSILQHGPSTAVDLADRFDLTPAAVRRHLSILVEVGHLTTRQQRVYGPRGRGRPAKVFVLTDAGRAEFLQSYDQLAIDALGYLTEKLGAGAVAAFAHQVMDGLEAEVQARECNTPAEALVEVLTEHGYVASLQPVGSGHQLCQYHCPVSQVARVFPELCEAETEVFGRVLGSHVQRLATIAHGDGVCTTHIPAPVDRPFGAGRTR